MTHLQHKRTALAAAALVGGLLAAPAAQANDIDLKEIALGILAAIVEGDRSYIEEHVAEDYRQHNPTVPDGRAGLLATIDLLGAQPVAPRITPRRVLRDGDLVAVHSELMLGEESVVFDLFRFEDGIAVEHWDAIQPRPATTASGRTMIDGPTAITDLDRTEANRALVVGFVTDILKDGRFERITEYIGATYHQHNPQIGDGVEGLQAFVAHLQANNISLAVTTIHNVVAEGNFVMTQSEGEVGGVPTAFYDLFRVEDGRIVEHWDILQAIPAEMAHDNGMF